jgi:hypothetical protein
VTREQLAGLAEIAQVLGWRQHVASVELTDFVHKHTGVRLSPMAIDELRNKLGWHLSHSAGAVIDLHARQPPAAPPPCERWCCRSQRWVRRWLPLSLLAVVHALAANTKG